jgi:hypothetical protein
MDKIENLIGRLEVFMKPGRLVIRQAGKVVLIINLFNLKMEVIMPYRSNSNKQSKSHTGNPSGNGIGGGLKDAHTADATGNLDELESRYTDNVDEPTIDTRLGSHPNRNTNKPHIDKPRYS